jgi:hypothetical protein
MVTTAIECPPGFSSARQDPSFLKEKGHLKALRCLTDVCFGEPFITQNQRFQGLNIPRSEILFA